MTKKFDLEELRQLLADDGLIIPGRITELAEFLSHLAAAAASKKRAMESLLAGEDEDEDELDEDEDELDEDEAAARALEKNYKPDDRAVMMSLTDGEPMQTQSANLERLGEILERFGVRLEVINETEVAVNAALWDNLWQAAETYSAGPEPTRMSIPLCGHQLRVVKRGRTDAESVDDFFSMLPSHQPGPKKGA